MRFIPVLILAFLVSCSEAPRDFRQFDQNSWSGILAFQNGQYPGALAHFEIAMATLPEESPEPYLYAAATALKLQQEEKAGTILAKALQHTRISRSDFENFQPLAEFWGTPVMDEFLEAFSIAERNGTLGPASTPLQREMDSLALIDQNLRNGFYDPQAMRRIDSTNMVRLAQIVGEIGWQQKLFPILWNRRQHYGSDHWFWTSFTPVIEKEIEAGRVRPSFWAQFEDEKLIRTQRQQRYGMYPYNYQQFPLELPDQVDSLRAAIGLPPLWYMNEVYQAPLPPGYQGTPSTSPLITE
ncbi:hypothetical protein OZ410_01045 [Robiginitalea sp. M366]|uniref:hypothetical protein n=1 Tax=Robiginitalea aestuariiviva TaxID=3036903 RepID=UPI00240D3C9E|nr:hypothetical protein [Robiginitalea aestuariiviva]MDG1570885.1 hypothetical protein [Robiginitalea aestuariiviva]